MRNPLKLAYIFAFCIHLFSCNSNKVEKPEKETVQSHSEDVLNTKPSDEMSTLENQIREDSLNTELRSTLASKYYSMGDLNKAEVHFLTILKQKPDNLNAKVNLGNIYYDSQKNEQAILYYEKSLLSDSKNINLRCDLATCYLRIKNYSKAIKILKKNIQMDKNHLQSHHNLSVIFKAAGNNQEADAEMAIYNKLSQGN